jgi:autotransporter-associated beta strand protein
MNNGGGQAWIAFDLGSVQTITGFHLWNYDESTSFQSRGVQNATMYVGTTMPSNGAVSQGPGWGTSAGSFTFAEATSAAGYTGNNYTFPAPVTTQYIEMYVGSNYGDAYTGISEIRFESNPNVPVGSPVQLATGAALDLNGGFEQIASLNDYVPGSSQGTVTNGAATSATLMLSPSGGTATFSGAIQDGTGQVSLVMNGAGTQILAGSNTYTGATTITAGTLQLKYPGVHQDNFSVASTRCSPTFPSPAARAWASTRPTATSPTEATSRPQSASASSAPACCSSPAATPTPARRPSAAARCKSATAAPGPRSAAPAACSTTAASSSTTATP